MPLESIIAHPLWRGTDFRSALSSAAPAAIPNGALPDVHRLSIDSRQVQQGDLFIALHGDPGPRFNPSRRSQVDGHDFVANAQAAGAVAALVSRPLSLSLPQLQVSDTYEGLWQLGRYARTRLNGDVVAITGSSGKTTAKAFLTAALDAYSPPGSLNNHIGVPLSLGNAPPERGRWVFEIGTSHPGEIAPLAAMVAPTLAILLNVHQAHIENFASQAALRAEKASLFSGLQADGKRVVHDDLGVEGFTFGYAKTSHARILEQQGDLLTLSLFGERLQARVPGGGVHRGLTLAAAILATALLGHDLSPALQLSHDLVPSGRGNEVNVSDIVLVDDSYNANPMSMRAAVGAFMARPCSGRRFLALGEMRELGDLSEEAHAQLMAELPEVDGVYLVGGAFSDQLTKRQAAVQHFPAANADLKEALVESLAPGDSLLIKGSNRVFWAEEFASGLAKDLRKKWDAAS